MSGNDQVNQGSQDGQAVPSAPSVTEASAGASTQPSPAPGPSDTSTPAAPTEASPVAPEGDVAAQVTGPAPSQDPAPAPATPTVITGPVPPPTPATDPAPANPAALPGASVAPSIDSPDGTLRDAVANGVPLSPLAPSTAKNLFTIFDGFYQNFKSLLSSLDEQGREAISELAFKAGHRWRDMVAFFKSVPGDLKAKLAATEAEVESWLKNEEQALDDMVATGEATDQLTTDIATMEKKYGLVTFYRTHDFQASIVQQKVFVGVRGNAPGTSPKTPCTGRGVSWEEALKSLETALDKQIAAENPAA